MFKRCFMCNGMSDLRLHKSPVTADPCCPAYILYLYIFHEGFCFVLVHVLCSTV